MSQTESHQPQQTIGFCSLKLQKKTQPKKKKIDKASIFNAYPQFIITQRQQKTHRIPIPIPNTNQWNLSDLKGFDGVHCLTDPTHSHSLSLSLFLSESQLQKSKQTHVCLIFGIVFVLFLFKTYFDPNLCDFLFLFLFLIFLFN